MATIATEFGAPLADEQTFEQPLESRTTRRIAYLFFATFWTIIFTGSVRKWLFPDTSAFYVLQEIPISLAYLYAIYKGYFFRNIFFLALMFLSAILVLQALLQMIFVGLTPFIALVGLHHYLYYLPMLLVFPLALTPRYRKAFIRCNVWAALPMVLLSVAQAMSPTTAWINHTSAGDSMGLPGVEVARISGPFNFTTYYGIWIGMAFALCLGEWLEPRSRRAVRSNVLLATATVCWALIALISGSRQNIMLCAAGAAGAFLVVAFTRSVRGILLVLLALLALPATGGLVYVLSPVEFTAIYTRFAESKANTNNDIGGRIGESFYGWIYEPGLSFIGAGIGQGVDAAHLGAADSNSFTYQLSEADTVRNVMELGTPIGWLWCILRFGMAFLMIGIAWRLIRISPHCLPLACMLFGQIGADLTRNATMTFTQVMVGYCFILGARIFPDYYEHDSNEPDYPQPTPTHDQTLSA